MVPRAEKRIDGVGEMVVSWVGHWEVSVPTRGWSFGSVEVGARREMEWMAETEGRERRVERMCEPTRPVDPTIAVDVIVADVGSTSIVYYQVMNC